MENAYDQQYLLISCAIKENKDAITSTTFSVKAVF